MLKWNLFGVMWLLDAADRAGYCTTLAFICYAVIKRLPLNDSGTDLCANLSCDLQKLDLVDFI